MSEEKATAVHYEVNSQDDASKNVESYHIAHEVVNSEPTAFLYLLVTVASVSHFMFGYDTGYISSALVSVNNDLGEPLTYGRKEFITSATSLGALITAVFAGSIADAIGRNYACQVANAFFVIGAVTQAAAQNVWTMIVGRFIMGFGVGIASVVSPLYITELAPAKWRGRLVMMASIIRTGAQLASYGIGAGLVHVNKGWRILVAISLFPTLLQAALLTRLPDTPRYLVGKNRLDEARDVMVRINGGASDKSIDAKIVELQEATYDPTNGMSAFKKFCVKYRELHTVPSNFRGLIIVCGMQGINQFTGFNSLMYFSATIFEMVGFKNATAVSILVAAINFIFTIAVFFFIDRLGRRKLMIISLAGMVCALVLAAVAFHFMDIKFANNQAVINTTGMTGWGIVILVAMLLYVAFFAFGTGAVPWQQSETFPMNVRGLGSSLACAVNWSGSLIIASTFLTMMEKITPTGTFAFFGAVSFISLICVFFLYPELGHLELEETKEILETKFDIKRSIQLSNLRKRQTRKGYSEEEL
ncbi:hypothetical protein BABINDRAFT_162562 [Babjeviella inositovora NRRL Y-12698]|uniref:Major facilitator superfamily (MFS) profile domain-containing protein n=1 Tax=Babjeviella inositovora NRRL Y-12698 TaxID=984486 RepID=A0A1E3QPJ4_9ASCO|nr:uncharacterized protein BABINDRAFT_162562 [Babjeviella inositovora NRRL Y-12698]ODQ78897.1 hypothetical protein BABINDRAFT_162562 [Babjeviella inositovora NRRL Y-12698]